MTFSTSKFLTFFSHPQSYYEKHHSLPSVNVSSQLSGLFDTENGKWLYGGKFKPDGCDLHIYQTPELQQCFTNSDSDISRPIYVIGDSRARLIYRSIVARITGQETLEDVKVHEDMSSDIVTPVKYFWSQSFDGEWEQVSHHKKMMTNAESG